MKKLYSELKKELGKRDASCEYIEVLVRTYEAHLIDKPVEELADQANIRINDYSPDIMRNTIRSMYFSSVTTQFEMYLVKAYQFLRTFSDASLRKVDGESYLKCIFKHIYGMQCKTDNYMRYLICEYYRLARNESVHMKENKSLENAYQELTAYRERITSILGGEMFPNQPELLCFDDFIIYSRTVKQLAYENVQHAKYSAELFLKHIEMKRFGKYAVGCKQWRRAVGFYLCLEFGLEGEKREVFLDEIIKAM